MSTTLEKEWIAVPVGGDEVVARGDTRDEVLDALGRETCPECGNTVVPDGYEVVAVPKAHKSVFI